MYPDCSTPVLPGQEEPAEKQITPFDNYLTYRKYRFWFRFLFGLLILESFFETPSWCLRPPAIWYQQRSKLADEPGSREAGSVVGEAATAEAGRAVVGEAAPGVGKVEAATSPGTADVGVVGPGAGPAMADRAATSPANAATDPATGPATEPAAGLGTAAAATVGTAAAVPTIARAPPRPSREEVFRHTALLIVDDLRSGPFIDEQTICREPVSLNPDKSGGLLPAGEFYLSGML